MQAVQVSQRQSCVLCGVKVALLVGVDSCWSGLSSPLRASEEIQKMERVLQHPAMGGFDRVQTLLNPDLATLQTEIENLFAAEYQPDDLILLYFSGCAICDESSNLHFAASEIQPEPPDPTAGSVPAIPASFIRGCMSQSGSTRQVVILDCHFVEEAIAVPTTNPLADVLAQLGGEGGVVLAASTIAASNRHATTNYTRYLIEGIETGAADRDGDGMIAVDELHEYARDKVQEASPTLQPEMYGSWEDDKICLAKAPVGDPVLEYRREVDRLAKQKQGKISTIIRMALNVRRQELRLQPEVAIQIEAEVLEPYREFQAKLQQYEEALNAALADRPSLSAEDQEDLQYLQQVLKLRDEDVASILAKAVLVEEAEPERVIEAVETPFELTSASSNPDLEDNLSSTRGVDYTRLRDLLRAGQWEAADHETHLVMLQVAGRKKDDWIRTEELADFSCTDLHTIDQLWVKYSNGRYGFSVQKRIWFSLGGQLQPCEQAVWQTFGDRLGWCTNQSWLYHDCLTFSLDAPEGHLPSGAWGGAFGCMMVCLFSRLESCSQA